jgi:hypothetical protein
MQRFTTLALESDPTLGNRAWRVLLKRNRPIELGEMVRPHLEIIYDGTFSAKRLSRDLAQRKNVPLKHRTNAGTIECFGDGPRGSAVMTDAK